MKILHIVGSFVPAYRHGGPIKSVSQLKNISAEDFAAVCHNSVSLLAHSFI